MSDIATPQRVLEYWFGSTAVTEDDVRAQIFRWFMGGPAVDAEVNGEFGATVRAALVGELDWWADAPRTRLALIIVLDQFTRNAFRDDPRTYDGDAKAQQLAVEAFDRGMHSDMSYVEQLFLATPLLHAEDLALQLRQDELVAAMNHGRSALYDFAYKAQLEQSTKYTSIIRRFNRFPHRNALLGRESSPAEIEFLETEWAVGARPSSVS